MSSSKSREVNSSSHGQNALRSLLQDRLLDAGDDENQTKDSCDVGIKSSVLLVVRSNGRVILSVMLHMEHSRKKKER